MNIESNRKKDKHLKVLILKFKVSLFILFILMDTELKAFNK